LQRIHRLTQGVPRRINLLCGRSLLGAWANGLHRVDRKMVDKAAAEVFGTDSKRSLNAGKKLTAYVIASVVLVIAAVAVFLLLPLQQAKRSLAQTGITLPRVSTAAGTALAPAFEATTTAPMTAGSSPVRAESPASRALEDIEATLPKLQRDINQAWRELASAWKLPESVGYPCQAALAQGLQCYRTSNLNVPMLRQLGRPGILTLQSDKGLPFYAVLVDLSGQSATLRIAGELHQVGLLSLGRLWRGDFSTYWRAPPGYIPDQHEGSAGASIDHLAKQLDQLDQTAPRPAGSAPQTFDAALRGRVRAFQRSQGLKADGLPGPMTFMQLERATGLNEARLQSESR
jgi:general secretion pathway protein A